jgi:hypothetical protein
LFHAFHCFFIISTVEIDCAGQIAGFVEHEDPIVRHRWMTRKSDDAYSSRDPWMMPNAILGYLEKLA